MAELQQNRYDKLIRRVGGIIGPGSMVSEAITELFPMIDVENVPGELLALMGTRVAFVRSSITAAGGLQSNIQLFNPVDSATLITLTTFILTTNAIQTLVWSIRNAALPVFQQRGALRDSRLLTAATNTAVGEIRSEIGGGTGAASGSTRVLANTPFTLTDPNGICILSPGFGLTVEATTVDSRLVASFMWRERTLEASEVDLSGGS